MISTKLKQMFDDPGEFDHIAFCVEDLPQIGQVKFFTGYSFWDKLRNFYKNSHELFCQSIIWTN